MKQSNRIALCFAGGHLRRWHANDIIGEERVDSHTWGMVSLILILHPKPSVELIAAVQFHDAGEMFSGDIPSPAKSAIPALGAADKEIAARWTAVTGLGAGELSPEDQWWLGFVDAAQAWLFSRRQVATGNSLMVLTAKRIAEVCKSMMGSAPPGAEDAWLHVDLADPIRRVTRDVLILETGIIYGS